jgi:hypothetical protein
MYILKEILTSIPAAVDELDVDELAVEEMKWSSPITTSTGASHTVTKTSLFKTIAGSKRSNKTKQNYG